MKIYHEQREHDQIMQFLMGLNDTYNPISGHILLMNPLPSVQKAYSLIIQEEKQWEIGSSSTENFSLAAAVQKYKGSNPSHLGTQNMSGDHSSFNNPSGFENQNRSGDSSSSSDFHCTYCDRDRHTIKTCYKLHGYPPRHRLFHGGGSNQEIHGNVQQQLCNRGRHSSNNMHGHPSTHQVHSIDPSTQHQSTTFMGASVSATHSLHQVLAGLYEEQRKQLTTAMVNLSKPSSENSDVFANSAGRFQPSLPSINSIFF